MSHTAQLADRLERFLTAFRPLHPCKPPVFQPRTVDTEALATFLDRVRGPLERRRARGTAINPWAVAGVHRREVTNSAILATFWSPQSCGTLAREFLNGFCRRIADHGNVLPTAEELAQPYAIRTEHCPVGEASERVDITIEGRSFVMGIEVKIDAGEGPQQLRRYAESIHRWSRQRGKRPCMVFLAPYRPAEAGVLSAGWDDVAAAARAVLKQEGDESNYHRFLLESFSRHIANFGG